MHKEILKRSVLINKPEKKYIYIISIMCACMHKYRERGHSNSKQLTKAQVEEKVEFTLFEYLS